MSFDHTQNERLVRAAESGVTAVKNVAEALMHIAAEMAYERREREIRERTNAEQMAE